MRQVFAEVRRVLRADGVMWLNIGDSYSSTPPGASQYADRSTTLASKRHSPATAAMRESVRRAAIDRTKFLPEKNMLGIPWRVAFALQDDGWTLRNDIIWHKPNAMPESVRDRLSCRYEHVFLFSKSPKYWFDLDAIKVRSTGQAPGNTPAAVAAYAAGTGTANGARRWGGNATSTLLDVHATRNPGDEWDIPTSPYPGAHYATMAPELARRCILAGCPSGGTVLDPFAGSGTTLMVARQEMRNSIGIDLDPRSCAQAVERIGQPVLDFELPAPKPLPQDERVILDSGLIEL